MPHQVNIKLISSVIIALIGVRVYPPSYFGDGTGAILLTDMQCLGSEQNLYSCNRGFDSQLESHSNDATIKCWTKSIFAQLVFLN